MCLLMMQMECPLLEQFGQETQHSWTSSIQMPPSTGKTCSISSIKKSNLMEFGWIWMKSPTFAMGPALSRLPLLYLTTQMICHTTLAPARYKTAQSLSTVPTTRALKKQTCMSSMRSSKPKQPTASCKTKGKDLSSFQEAQPSAPASMAITGLETMLPLGPFFKPQSPTFSIAT